MIVFNLPTVIFGLCYWSGHQIHVSGSIDLFFHIAWYAKSAANPIIFGLLNRKFRVELFRYKVFKVCCEGTVKNDQSNFLEYTVEHPSKQSIRSKHF